MKRTLELVLLLPIFAIALLPAQQTSAPKLADVKSSTLPNPSSTTAYDPFFSEGDVVTR
jgi:hypothetical protein